MDPRSSREGDGIMEGDDGNGTHISFVYANEKRFSDFHSLFRSVPDDEKLIEDYGCALQKEILVQGRLYISENHVCFNANIFGWVTNLVIAFSEITAIEKRLTAFVIPNAISIVTTTNTKGHFFASFLSRDAAHDLLMAAWRKSFPCAANASVANYNNNTNNNSSNNNSNSYQRQNRSNVTVNDDDDYSNDAQSFISARGNSESRKNRHRRSFSNASQPWTGDENTEWAEDDAAEGKTNDGLRRKGSKRAVVKKLLKDVIGPIIPDEEQRNASLSPNSGNKRVGRPRSVSELPPRPTSFDCTGNRESIVAARSSLDQDSLPPVVQRARAGTESLPNRRGVTVVSSPTTTNASLSGTLTTRQSPPATPSPSSSFARVRTTCQCSKDGRHYANQYLSETYPGSVESLWKLLFDSQFAKGFLTSEAMKGADVQEESWKSSTDGTSSKVTRYTKWLGMPIGPKTTKAILTDVCEYKNFEEYVTTVTTTSTPDVPSGGSFTTKVRTCLTWAGPHQVQIVVTGAVEFTKSSWIKGQIEKGAAEGMTAHYKELDRCLRKYIADHPKDFPTGTDTGAATAVVGAARPPASVMKSAVKAGHGGAGPEKASRKEATSTPPSVSFDTRQTKDDKGSSLSTMAGQTKSVSVGSSLADFRSMLPKTLELEWNTHLALVSVLIMVLVANVYIWCQISNVSFQIEKFADGSHGHHHHHPEYQAGQQPYGTSRRRSVWTSSGATMLDDEEMDAFEREEAFAREQEEVMWAWLTEREARRREYMRASAVQRTESMSRPEERTGKVGTEVRLSETESKLQARIDDLEQQLEALERQAVVMRSKSEVLEKESSQSSFA
ncbi:hypothetical protein BGX28_007514 [Mortierella sp. GBA30]|nr:hypothetical protein BGX28_007514 [Mortierella sp. GBA30]